MRLLIVSQYFWPENFRINELAEDFYSRGHEVTVLTGWPNYPNGKFYEDFQRQPELYQNFKGVKIVRVPLLARGTSKVSLLLNYLSFTLSASLLGPWKLRNLEFDAIFTYQPSPITIGIPAAILRTIKQSPMALWVLDLWPESLRAVGIVKSNCILWSISKLVSWVYKHSDLILIQSKLFTDNIAQHTRKNAKIIYFPAWTDDVFQNNNQIKPAKEVPINPKIFTIVFAGNIGEAQDFPAIIEAIENLKDRTDVRWIIVGDGRMSHWVANQIYQRKLEKNVFMAGRHKLERMPEFFSHADALLVSLKKDPIFSMTIPGKIQAYLGTGIPILAMLDGEGANIIAEANAGLVSPSGNGAALAKNVINLIEMDKKERIKMGENGKNYCKINFNRHLLMRNLEELLINISRTIPRK